MQMTLESTQSMTVVNGAPARVWYGRTAEGTPVVALVALIAAREQHERGELERQLAAVEPPDEVALPDVLAAIPLTMFVG